MHPNLSFEQAPPISVPYRFFVTAPWFGVIAGLLLVWTGSDALVSRWAPGALAATHLLVAGFMLQAMAGALLQFVPVAAGGNVWRPSILATLIHPLLIVAALLLPSAFLLSQPGIFAAAALVFGAAVAVYVLAVGTALLRTPAKGPTIMALRLAIFGLVVTVALGVTLAGSLAGGRSLPLIEITQVHAAWGLGGWALMLVIGVSYFVVPMFQLTPAYPGRLAWSLPVAIFFALLLWSGQLVAVSLFWQAALPVVGALLVGAYAVATLWLQYRRRRKVNDPTLMFFRFAMASVLLFSLSLIWLTVDTDTAADPRAAVWLGLLAIPGIFVSVISGMLYKIVPFLNWLHLQRISPPGTLPPNMREMIPERAMYGQLAMHGAAVAALLAAVFIPALVRPAGLLFAASCAWLGVNLLVGVRAYLRFKSRILAA